MVLHVQVTVPTLQGRYRHSATAISLSPGLVEVILFGGVDSDSLSMAKTQVLRFGECVSKCTLSVSMSHFSSGTTFSLHVDRSTCHEACESY